MRTNTLMVLAEALVVLAPPALAQSKKFEPFDFPTSDTNGVYTMLEMRKVGRDQVETLVRQRMLRTGNVAFMRRLIDCKAMRFKTLASAFDDMEGLKRSKPDPNWSAFVNGSSAHGTAVAACARL